MVSLTQALIEGEDLFEGPEKTLTLCFKQRKVGAGSLRLITEERWAEVLRHAKCEILSSVVSTPLVTPQHGKAGKQKRVSTKGLTGYLLSESSLFLSDSWCWWYLLSESSLFLSDTTLSLKTCGRTTPLAALEPILNTVVPNWQQKCPDEYLQYTSFSRLGYKFPDEQLEPHTSWAEEVAYLHEFFKGESLVLGSEASSLFHIYVANYVPQGEIFDAFSTQVTLTDLDPKDSLATFAEGGAKAQSPLRTHWKQLHGDDRRSEAANMTIDEHFFEPIGYSANGVFGRHFTTVHATPQPSCSYLSVETTMPMTCEARHRFVLGSEGLCRAGVLSITELAMCSALLSRSDAPKIPGFTLKRSSQSVGSNFACTHHHYVRELEQVVGPFPTLPAAPRFGDTVAASEAAVETAPALANVPVVEVAEVSQAAVRAASLCLASPELGKEPNRVEDLPLAMLDLGAVRRRAEVWRQHLPRVEPFYAVKCNNHPALVQTLWQTWQEWGYGGFDCASPSEMAIVAAMGCDLGERVVYANPCKHESAVRFAKTAGVRHIVFDNPAELVKLHRLHPTAELLLRVQTDDSLAKCPLSNKFGARVEDAGGLLAQAKELGLTVVGVSFHVGSGCSQAGAFCGALRRARAVFDEMEQQGFRPELLDIGGGFPGHEEEGQVNFADHAADISPLLEELFPRHIRVIAEPGRFFAASAQAVLATVISVADAAEGHRYYLNDGLYGSFNCLLYDHATVPQPTVLRDGMELQEKESEEKGSCTVFGPTCDGFDVVSQSLALPRLRVGDRLLFPNMGAYTTAASTSFNGFAPATGFVYESRLLPPSEVVELVA